MLENMITLLFTFYLILFYAICTLGILLMIQLIVYRTTKFSIYNWLKKNNIL